MSVPAVWDAPVGGVRLNGLPDFPSMGVTPALSPKMDLQLVQGPSIALEAAACVVVASVVAGKAAAAKIGLAV